MSSTPAVGAADGGRHGRVVDAPVQRPGRTTGWARRVPVLAPRFPLAAAALAVVVLLLPFTWPWNLVLVNALLVVLAIVDALLAVAPRDVDVVRRLATSTTMDVPMGLEWTIVNRSRRAAWVEVRDEIVPSVRATSHGGARYLSAGGRAVLGATVTPTRRGRWVLPGIAVRVRGPLGLVLRQERRAQVDAVRVYPSFPARREAELRVQRGRVLEVGRRSVRAHGGGTDFEQLRDYAVDDDFRRIDWAATARAAKPIVRTFRAEQHQRLIVLLDTGRTMAAKVADVPRLEHAMDAVLALATVASHVGDEVALVPFDAQVGRTTVARPGARGARALADAVYDLQPRLIEPSYARAFAHVLARHHRRSLVVLLTDLAEEIVVDALLPSLGLLQRNHALLVAGVDDPDLRRWRTEPAGDEPAAYRRAAAAMALGDRTRAVDALRARGVTVVDSLPGRLGSELTDAYLYLKATGSL